MAAEKRCYDEISEVRFEAGFKLRVVLKFQSSGRMEFFTVTDKNGIRTVTINNERKKNALNKQAYQALANILNGAVFDDQIKAGKKSYSA